jgi:hypothetical protein
MRPSQRQASLAPSRFRSSSTSAGGFSPNASARRQRSLLFMPMLGPNRLSWSKRRSARSSSVTESSSSHGAGCSELFEPRGWLHEAGCSAAGAVAGLAVVVVAAAAVSGGVGAVWFWGGGGGGGRGSESRHAGWRALARALARSARTAAVAVGPGGKSNAYRRKRRAWPFPRPPRGRLSSCASAQRRPY